MLYPSSSTIAVYAAAEAPTTARRLPRSALTIGVGAVAAKHLVEVAEVGSTDAMQQVLELRRDCYLKAGKVGRDVSAAEMAQPDDATARVFSLSVRGRLVGTFRLRVPSSGDVLDTIDGPLGGWPASFPDKARTIEVSSLCIRRGFRRTDAMKRVFETVHRTLVECGRSHILIAADERLARKYRFIGFAATGMSYLKPTGNRARLHVLISNQRPLGVYGLHADPLRWNMFLRDVTEELLAEGKLRHTGVVALIFALYRRFGWLARACENVLAPKLGSSPGKRDAR